MLQMTQNNIKTSSLFRLQAIHILFSWFSYNKKRSLKIYIKNYKSDLMRLSQQFFLLLYECCIKLWMWRKQWIPTSFQDEHLKHFWEYLMNLNLNYSRKMPFNRIILFKEFKKSRFFFYENFKNNKHTRWHDNGHVL